MLEFSFFLEMSNGFPLDVDVDWTSFEQYEWVAYDETRTFAFTPDQLSGDECIRIDRAVENYAANEMREVEND